MAISPLLECDGLSLGPIAIPKFEVATGALVAIVDPREHGKHSFELLELLAGIRPSPEIKLRGRAELVVPQGWFTQRTSEFCLSIRSFLEEPGLAPDDVTRTIHELNLAAEASYRDLQLTQKFLLGIRAAHLRGAQIIVFTTAGLDPRGVEAVLREVSNQQQCAGIDLIHASLLSFYRSLKMCDRTICLEPNRR